LESHCKDLNIRAIPMGGDLDVGLIWRLGRIIRSEQPDIVHIHSRRGADVFGGIAARRLSVPSILTRRVDNPETRLGVFKYRFYDCVICISQAIVDVMRGTGIPQQRLHLVHSAVDTQLYQRSCDEKRLSTLNNIQADGLRVAMAAQMIERKGHLYLLEALPEVLRHFPGLQVWLLGRGPLQQTITEKVKVLDLQQHVLIPGFVDRLEDILPCFDLLVHPALMEGLGVILLQASAAGIPVVAAQAGGIPEVVKNNVNGLLVPPADSQALATAMIQLLGDEALRKRLGQQAQQRTQQLFSIDAMVEGNIAVYQQVLQSHA
jgi:glycosyltransferase involved in cell wall biosynthesis